MGRSLRNDFSDPSRNGPQNTGVFPIVGTLSTDDGDGNGDVGTERKDWGENAVVARILNIKLLPNLQT